MIVLHTLDETDSFSLSVCLYKIVEQLFLVCISANVKQLTMASAKKIRSVDKITTGQKYCQPVVKH